MPTAKSKPKGGARPGAGRKRKLGFVLRLINIRETYWKELRRRRAEEGEGTITDQVDQALKNHLT